MIFRRSLLFALFVLVMYTAKTQDLHFTYFEMSPLTFNPAQAGAFSGSIRLSGHYRGQWLGTGGYTTPAFAVDSPVMRGFRDNDWIGVGMNFYSDNAGSGDLKTSGGGLNVAYHFGFDKNYSQVFTVGLKYGSYSRKLNSGFNLTLRDELISGTPGPDAARIPIGGNNSGVQGNSRSDFALGFLYKSIIDKTSQVEIGFSADHITSPRTSFQAGAGSTNVPNPNPDPNEPPLNCNQDPTNPLCRGRFQDRDRRNIRFTAQTVYTRFVNEKLKFSPGALVQFTKLGAEIEAHVIAGYLFNEKKGVVLNGGLGIRAIGPADASIFLGADIKDLKIGAAFDLGLIGFQTAPQFQNAFEIGASYIIKIYKQPDVEPVIFCPRF